MPPTGDAGPASDVSAAAGHRAALRPPGRVSLVLEQPYRLDRRPDPKEPEAWKAYIAELRAWNDGSVGTLVAPLPEPEGHPDPRVIVNVDRARGGLDAKTVQRIARQYHWIHVVRCYQLGAYKNPSLKGWTRARFGIGKSGKVGARTLRSSELDDPAVAKCLVERLGELTFPRRKASTSVDVAIKVSPGDDPMPPPADAIVPGTGELTREQMLAPVRGALGKLEACVWSAAAYAPELWGRIALRFHVSERGTLEGVFDDVGRFPDKRLSQCILREARSLSFPRPLKGELRFVVPVRFSTDRSSVSVPGGAVPLAPASTGASGGPERGQIVAGPTAGSATPP